MNYFYIDRNNSVVGPYNEEELRKLHINGTVSLDTNVCKEGDETWQPYRNLQTAAATGSNFPSPLPTPPVNNQKPVSITSAILWFLCCMPIGFMQWGQAGKGWIWVLITIVTGGVGGLAAIIDYWMSYSAQDNRQLKEWEFFPR